MPNTHTNSNTSGLFNYQYLLIPFIFSAWLISPSVLAECGGQQNCIAVSVDPAISPAHGTEDVGVNSPPLNFLDQLTETTSSSQSIFVAAVTGPAGTLATLDAISFGGANPDQFSIVAGSCVTGVPSLLQGGSSCSISVTFSPSTPGFKSALVFVSSSSITRTIPLTGTGIETPLPLPEITSGQASSGSIGENFNYQISADNDPIRFNATGLPDGLSVDTVNGILSGTPTTEGVFNTTISAVNATGSSSLTLIITIASNVPVITSSTTASGITAQAFNYSIISENNPTSYGANALPEGLSLEPSSGLISGIPAMGGTTSVSISATNATGTANQVLVISITSVLPTVQNLVLSVPLNTPTTINISQHINGPFITGIRIDTLPTLGVVSIDGTLVTYTPRNNVFGNDSFTYIASNVDGDSSAATVSVVITGRPDPTVDPTVTSIIDNHADVARRFSRSQVSNFQRRMETLHQGSISSLDTNGASGLAEGSTTNEMPDLIKKLISATQTGSFNLSSSLGDNMKSTPMIGDVGIWVEGNVNFGTRDKTSNRQGLRFTTDGISVGIDRRITNQLILGVGLGFARGETDIGTEGSKTDSSGSSVSLYGSYQPSANTFVDSMLGYGTLEYDTERFVSAIDSFAVAQFDSSQLFASIAAGYEFREHGLLISPYGRLDVNLDRLDGATETGAGLYSLSYSKENRISRQLALGLRIEMQHETNFGWARPHFRLEFSHEFNNDLNTRVRYADQISGTQFRVSPSGVNRNALLMGLGSDFAFNNGLVLGFDYQNLRSFDDNKNNRIRFWFNKSLNGKSFFPRIGSFKLLNRPVRVEAGYLYENNLNRASNSDGWLSDNIFSFSASSSAKFSLGSNSRFIAKGTLSGKKFYSFAALDHFGAGLQGEFQYRSSGHVTAPTWGLFAKADYQDYTSKLRSGTQLSFGINLRQPLSDKIFAFVALSRNIRNADHEVFDTKDYRAKFSLDYSLGQLGSLYLGGEIRRGDIVTSEPGLIYGDLVDVVTEDDGYRNRTLFASRFEGKTLLWSLGYNLPLGSRDSIDFSWRRAVASPLSSDFDASYAVNQFSVFYLMRF